MPHTPIKSPQSFLRNLGNDEYYYDYEPYDYYQLTSSPELHSDEEASFNHPSPTYTQEEWESYYEQTDLRMNLIAAMDCAEEKNITPELLLTTKISETTNPQKIARYRCILKLLQNNNTDILHEMSCPSTH